MIASERLIPTQAAPTVATYTISSDGNRLGPELTVLSLVVDRQVNRIPTATLVIRDGEVSAQTFKVSESGDFNPGKEIVIELGYRASNTEIFRGEVTGQQLKIRNQRSLLVVTIKDPAYKMSVGRRSRYFSDQTDSDAWEAIISSASLSTTGDGTTAIVPELTQHHCTDWDFVMSRVEANGMVCIVRAGELEMKKPTLAPTAALKLEFGANLLSFDAALDVRDQFTEANATAWRPTDAEAVTETSPPALGGAASGDYTTDKQAEVHERNPEALHHGGDLSVDELTGWASAVAERSRLARIRGAAEFQGTAAVIVGDTVEL
ncbi:MAG: Rhs element Vgr protein, partial [Bacteroidota bacterium]